MPGKLGDMLIKITGDNAEFDSAIDRSSRKLESFAKASQQVGKKLSTWVTAPLVGLAAAAVKASANMESLRASFETLTGSTSQANELIEELTQFAASTPFQLDGLAKASQTMLAFGINVEDVLPNLQQLGDIAQGDNEKLRALTLAFSQIQSTGRLMGQDLLQLINAGFNPLQVISEQTGESMSVLKDQMSAGAISAEQVADAFRIATSEGGRFYGGMERASQTLNGLTSTLWDNVKELGRSFGDILLPAMKENVEEMTTFVQKLAAMDDGTKQMILKVGALVAAIGPAILGISAATKAVNALRTGLTFLAANPIVLAISGITALGVALAGLAKKRREAKLDELLEQFAEVEGAAEASAEQIEAVQRALGLGSASGFQDAAEQVAQLAVNLGMSQQTVVEIGLASENVTDQYKEQLLLIKGQLIEQAQLNALKDLEIARMQGLEAAEARAAEIQRQRLEQQAQLTAQQQAFYGSLSNVDQLIAAGALTEIQGLERKIELREEEIERVLDLAEAGEMQATAAAATVNEQTTAIERYTQRLVELREVDEETTTVVGENIDEIAVKQDEKHKKRLADLEAERQAALNTWQTELNIAQQVTSQINALGQALFANQSQRISNQERQDRLRIENSIMSEEEKAAAFAALDEEIDAKRRALARKEAIANKAFAIFDIGVKTAMGIMGALGMLPPRPGLATAIGILGAAQLAAVAAKPLPALAEGGIIPARPGGTTATVGEAGQPEVVFPLDRLEDFLSTRDGSAGGGLGDPSGQIHLVVNMDAKPILDQIFPATRGRRVLIDARAVV